MERTQRILKTCMAAWICLAVLCIVLFESQLLLPGGWADRPQLEFVATSVMELATLAAIPTALRLFRLGPVERRLKADPARALLTWGLVRLCLLGLPLVACAAGYYVFGQKPALGYLAIILFLSMLFVVPTRSRCESETHPS